ncbi:DHA1 family bicyclomycin/chloramphenicol resistance-like MFS transporter [Pseudarthrobacter sp. W1I19]|uniref:multidrug effflux MFS transporter n=1 Tax=Pseudarthrobacter sp. W1I19 TaxID=3042288 RepID=UPI00277EAFF1|nr:multidrug effflux MFS transporter [Pseudarthrobacter sp. W1I19]MDQ0921946.1 DHA1 family bicyclomycin/chloramphenicol resistance-like MFS transporter [Pseudarthrobacter sp. W1I19]
MLPTATRAPAAGAVPATLVATVIFLTAVAPLATDMYVPAFPRVSADFGTTASAVQLTLSTFFAGMGLGQLVGGPFSDQRGRRLPLVAGTVLMAVASVACALAPNIALLMIARFLQGFGGGWAMVIGRAVIVDLAHGSQLVRVLNIVMGIGGVAPIISPLLGAVILQLTGWRMTFWTLAALGILMTFCTLFVVPESLPPEKRHSGGLAEFGRAAKEVLSNRSFVGYVAVASSAFIALFAYVATSAFILQNMNGLSPVMYSIVFAANAGGMTIAALVSARMAGRVPTRKVILVGQLIALAAGVAMLAGALWWATPLLVAMGSFFALMVAQGLINTNGGALASAEVPRHPGTSSAVLGLVQWTTAGIVAPIAGLGGEDTAVPMALLMIGGALLSLFGLLVLARPHVHSQRKESA